jgi:hypothetical protein
VEGTGLARLPVILACSISVVRIWASEALVFEKLTSLGQWYCNLLRSNSFLCRIRMNLICMIVL